MPSSREKLDTKPWVPLSIGAVNGGDTRSAIHGGLRRLARSVREAVESLPAGDETMEASVNVVFHIPGRFMSPDYDGLRTGSWIGRKRCQVVQVAVPAHLEGPKEVAEFLAASLEEAVPLAVERIKRFRRSADLSTTWVSEAGAASAAAMRRDVIPG